MKTKLHENKTEKSLCSTYDFLKLLLLFVALSVVNAMNAQVKKKSGVKTRSVYHEQPYGYSQVGNTLIYYGFKQSYDNMTIDVMGKFEERYLGSTYSDGGYKVAMKVGDNPAVSVNCQEGTTDNGVSFFATVEQQGELARICYIVTNTNETDVTVSLGTHADVMIGDNDMAPISRKVDTMGNTYGLTMKDGSGAQLCVLFGAGLAGVTSVNDFWFGGYSANSDPNNMVGEYYAGNNYMEENGSYDSGMGWCWKDRVIAAGGTVVFSYLIGVGDVNLEPSSSFEVTPDDLDGWNDISRPHRLTLAGEYESPAGLEGRIEYAVEDEEEWHALTDMLNSGDEFNASLVANFDASKQKHVIHFRTVDNVGNATMLPPIEYLDVSYYPVTGIADMTYTGEPLYQTNLVCDIDAEKYVTSRYSNNVNAGTATFYVEGLFPYTIGRKAYSFKVNPAPLSGDISLYESEYVYNGEPFTPEWAFTESGYAVLVKDKDFQVEYENNVLPGTGNINVEGIGNYTGILSQTFFIDKALLTDAQYSVVLPDCDISYDELPHAAKVNQIEGVGEATVEYSQHGKDNSTTLAPSSPGSYDIYITFADGELYYGMPRTRIGSFTIYHFDDTEWAVLEEIREQLIEKGWPTPWDMSQGAKSISSFEGLTIEQGHVVGLNLEKCNLLGDFPWEVFNLPNLSELNLSDNNLSGDIGSGMIAVKQANPDAAANLKTVNVSNNKFSGNIALFANSCAALQTLDASHNGISDVIPMISPNVTTLNLSYQTIDKTLNVDLATDTPETVMAEVPTVLVYDHEAQTYKDELDFLCTAADIEEYDIYNSDEWGIMLHYGDGNLTVPIVSYKQNEYHGESGDVLNVKLVNDDGINEGCTLKMHLGFAMGDSNFNGKVDITDLQAMILQIFGRYDNMPFNFTAANLHKDDVLNVQDVVEEVNLLLAENMTDVPSKYMAKASAGDKSTVTDAFVYCNGENLVINSSVPVAAFDVVVSKASALSVCDGLSALGMDCVVKGTVGGTHIIGYSLNGGTLPVGETVIATFKTNAASVSSVVLASENATLISVAANKAPTYINNVDMSMVDVEIIDGKLYVTTDGSCDNVAWNITALDGTVLGKGVISGNASGRIATEVNINGVVIVTLKSDNFKFTKKITKNK